MLDALSDFGQPPFVVINHDLFTVSKGVLSSFIRASPLARVYYKHGHLPIICAARNRAPIYPFAASSCLASQYGICIVKSMNSHSLQALALSRALHIAPSRCRSLVVDRHRERRQFGDGAALSGAPRSGRRGEGASPLLPGRARARHGQCRCHRIHTRD